MATENQGRELPAWKKAVFAAVAVVGFFAAVELVLAMAGVSPAADDEDPWVGFASTSRLYEDFSGPDGEQLFATAYGKWQLFNLQYFPRQKPAGTFRIFSVGGSTTYGRPYDDALSFSGWLREYLREAAPGTQWEVINAGGVSYASYRVARLMRELVEYEPDLFIVYSGHNEFLERRTYPAIMDAPELVPALGGLAARSRLYGLGAGWLKAGKSPQFERTVLEAEVAAVLDDSVGPESYQRDDDLAARVAAHYRYNLARMTELARTAGAQILLIKPAANLRDAAPFKSDASDPSRDAAALFEQGSRLYQAGDYDQARAAFQRAVDEDICPLRITSPLLAEIDDVARERGAAVLDFEALLAAASEHGAPGADFFVDHVHLTAEGYGLLAREIFSKLGDMGVHQGELTKPVLSQVDEIVMARFDARALGVSYRNLARVLAWAGKLEEAGALAEKAIELLGVDVESLTLAGRDAAARGDSARAVELFSAAIEGDPNYADARIRLGGELLGQGDLAGAEEQLRRGLELDPDSVAALNNLGLALAGEERFAEALELYGRALEIEPERAATHSNVGLALSAQGRTAAALEAFERAVDLDGKNPTFLSNFGMGLVGEKRYDEAARVFERLVEQSPDDARMQFNLALALQLGGRVEEALSHYRAALRIAPDYADARRNLEVALGSMGR